MAVLTRSAILREMEKGTIEITPFDPSMVGPASVDLSLSPVFRAYAKKGEDIPISDETNFKESTERKVVEGFFLLMPGETVLGMTAEKIKLPPNICGWLQGRSRFARMGLLVHISASFMQPGIENHQVLELTNFGPNPLRLYPGTKVCQFIFERTEGEASYEGAFKEQSPAGF